MAAVEQQSVGDGPAPLVSQAGDEQGHQARPSEVVEQAKLELSARYGFQLDEAFELLSALARSQRCSVEDYAYSIVKSGGRLDGDLRGDSGASLISSQKGSATTSGWSELVIEAPSPAAAFVLAGSLAHYRARPVVEGGAWRVVVDRCSSFSEGVPGALSRTKQWLAACGVATASVTLHGETYLLDASTDEISP
jgi:hypothetical protein